ncbi:metallopeptidase TldD-related protein, partial [Kitasatospora nipponensis]
GAAFTHARKAGQALYGFARHEVDSTYLGTSAGLRLRHDQPTGTLELNAKANGGSAWVGATTEDFRDVDLAALCGELSERLAWGSRRIELPAGRYEALLPPSAVADLMVYLHWSMGARDAAEGRTVFSRAGGGTRVGERLSRLALTLRSDPAEPGLRGAPFVIAHASGDSSSVFDNGLPLAPTEWIAAGELSHLQTTRHTAALTGLPVRPPIDNLVLERADRAGAPTLAEMVAGTERGLLLTCLWYIREVDPATLLLTGLTRDGVYLVEDGRVVGEVNNFRFNESPVDLLGRVTEAGRTERCLPREWGNYFSRVAMPPLRVADFNMSSVSQAS